MIGTLFIRRYERSERVYAAMVVRDFDGQSRILNRLSFTKADTAFGICRGLASTSVVNLLVLSGGEAVALIGNSGVKSTLLVCLNGYYIATEPSEYWAGTK